ncbi:hypothetical protein SE17_15850 [Kouleothrix aurantiaca]|uniref:Uncharacterized protein n=1 Tax=Kouleothrix aurantiaca TaxID=186479 RepID=A0A0P9HCX0_9CHLR|nr:hypothetical protein SE17_15850 [Kouleothrix aurantiaca]
MVLLPFLRDLLWVTTLVPTVLGSRRIVGCWLFLLSEPGLYSLVQTSQAEKPLLEGIRRIYKLTLEEMPRLIQRQSQDQGDICVVAICLGGIVNWMWHRMPS